MSQDIPVQIVIAAFKDQTTANRVLDELKQLQKSGQIKIDDAAVLYRDANDKLHIQDTHDWGFGRGALAGGTVGLVAGLIAGGPIGWAVLGSAAAGGAIASVHHTYGFDEARLRKLGEGLKPGNSAIVAVVEHVWVARVEAAMRQQSTDMVVESISKDVAEQLAAGKDVAYTVVGTGDAVMTGRVATGEGETQISDVTYTSQGVVAEAADITKDKLTYGAVVADAQGASGVIIEATPEGAKDAEGTTDTTEPEASKTDSSA
jgi:uncharacterized membrane protein